MQRFLKSQLHTFKAGIEASEISNEPTEIWDDSLLVEKLKMAKHHADSEQWPSAIESLSTVIQHSTGKLRREAIVARINSLFSSGEHFLGTIEAIGWFTHSDHRQFRSQLIELITREAGQQRNHRQQEMYSIVAALNDDSRKNVMELANRLVENRRFLFALMILSGNSNPRAQDLILRCCYQLGWWNRFETTLAEVEDIEKRNKWSGLMQLRLGNYLSARKKLAGSGGVGKRWFDHWKKGDVIFNQLSHQQKSQRLQGVESWSVWEQSNPGPRHWVAEPQSITKSSGTATVYATIAGTTAQYFRSLPDDPAVMEIEGPCRIRIETRPLHLSPKNDLPINDWLFIHNDAQSEPIPIINNFSSRLLEIRGADQGRVGELVEAEILLPAGRNLLRIHAEEEDILFRVLVSRPEVSLGVLPQVNPFTREMLGRGNFDRPCQVCQTRFKNCQDCVRMVCRDAKCCSAVLKYHCLCSRANLPADSSRSVSNPFRLVSHDVPRRRAIAALRLAQTVEEYRDENAIVPLIQLREILDNNPGRRDLKRIYSQLKQNFTWQRYRYFDRQAGIRSIKYSGWIPESPEIRIRKSLVDDWDWEYALHSSNDLELDFQSDSSTSFRIFLQRPRVSFLPLNQSSVRFYQPGRDEMSTLIDPQQVVDRKVRLSAGAQQVTLRQVNPTINHFVGVNVIEELDNGKRMLVTDQQGFDKERIFQVATEDEPIKFRVTGPAIIRIDQSDETLNVVASQTVTVDEVGRKFELYPTEGDDVGHFRIFELVPGARTGKSFQAEPLLEVVNDTTADELVEGVIQQIAYHEEIAPFDTLSLRSPDDPPEIFQINDYNELGFQEQGTWFFDVGYRERRSLDEAPRPIESGRFFDINIGRHFYNPWNDTYTRNRFLVRPRVENGTTFGFEHRGSTSLPILKCDPNVRANGWSPYRLTWNAYSFIQNAGTPLVENANSTPWTAGGWLRLARRRQINECWSRRPTVTGFARFLSEDQNNFAAGDLDQDVFTPYKRNHRYGLRISDTFTRQHCLDKRFWFRPYLATNEDQLVPDNLGFQTGTDQLIGPLQLNLSYRFTQFLVDNDRELASIQNVIGLDATLERWHGYRRRSEIRFSIRHDVDDDEGTSFGFNIINFINHGRGYRDIDPNLLKFRSLKEHRAARHYHYLLE